MAYTPPVTPEVNFNFTVTPYVPPVTPEVNFEMTTDDDDDGGASDPRKVQHFVIT